MHGGHGHGQPLGVSSLLPPVGLRTECTRVISFYEIYKCLSHLALIFLWICMLLNNVYCYWRRREGELQGTMLIVLSDISGQVWLSSREDRSLHCGAALFLRSYPWGHGASRPYWDFPREPWLGSYALVAWVIIMPPPTLSRQTAFFKTLNHEVKTSSTCEEREIYLPYNFFPTNLSRC